VRFLFPPHPAPFEVHPEHPCSVVRWKNAMRFFVPVHPASLASVFCHPWQNRSAGKSYDLNLIF